MRSGIIYNIISGVLSLLKVFVKVGLIVCAVYFFAILAARPDREELQGNVPHDLIEKQKPAFYFSVLPCWYDAGMTSIKNSPVKEAGIALMSEGLQFVNWLSLSSLITKISSGSGNSAYAQLSYIRSKGEFLDKLNELQLQAKVDSIDQPDLNTIKNIVSDINGVSAVKWLPALTIFGSDNQFHADLTEVLEGGQQFNSLTLALKLTLILSLFSYLLAIFGGTTLALLYMKCSGKYANMLHGILQVMYIFPVFCIAILAVQFFTSSYYSPYLNWFPGPGSFLLLSSENSFVELLFQQSLYLILPSLIVAIPLSAGIALRWIAGMKGEILKPYIITLKSKGLEQGQINFTHILRNVSLPMVLYFGLLFPALISGILLVENIFAIGGIGRLSYQSVMNEDLSMLLVITAIVATFSILFNKLTRVVMNYIDPRIKTKLT